MSVAIVCTTGLAAFLSIQSYGFEKYRILIAVSDIIIIYFKI